MRSSNIWEVWGPQKRGENRQKPEILPKLIKIDIKPQILEALQSPSRINSQQKIILQRQLLLTGPEMIYLLQSCYAPKSPNNDKGKTCITQIRGHENSSWHHHLSSPPKSPSPGSLPLGLALGCCSPLSKMVIHRAAQRSTVKCLKKIILKKAKCSAVDIPQKLSHKGAPPLIWARGGPGCRLCGHTGSTQTPALPVLTALLQSAVSVLEGDMRTNGGDGLENLLRASRHRVLSYVSVPVIVPVLGITRTVTQQVHVSSARTKGC